VIVPRGHALTQVTQLTLEKLATYPLITYSPQFTGRSHIDEAFATKSLEMDVVLTAIDADVIKTYTELGLGVGIVAAMAFDAKRDANLHAIDAGHLFRSNTTRLAVKRAAYLRGYAYAFIHAFVRTLLPRSGGRREAGGERR
jgi:LysR family cys regulon transcriptional activator